MKRMICAVCAAILLTGCSAPESSESSVELYETESTASATTMSSLSERVSRTTQSRTTAAAETETTAETTVPPQTTIPEGAVTYRLSGLITASFYCRRPPASYCVQKDGKTVLELRHAVESAGFRRDGEDNTEWQYQKDGQTARFGLGQTMELSDGTAALDELHYFCGGQAYIVSQQSPRKVQYALDNGTGITEDQLMLIVYLTEQLSADPQHNPLDGLIPDFLTDRIDGTIWYYLP